MLAQAWSVRWVDCMSEFVQASASGKRFRLPSVAGVVWLKHLCDCDCCGWMPSELYQLKVAPASNDGKSWAWRALLTLWPMHEGQINAVHAEVGKVISSSSENSCVVGVSVGDAGGVQTNTG
jgi:hypothetical protein